MTEKQNALERVRVAAVLLHQSQLATKQELERFASLCREVYDETGANDREIAEATSVEGFDGYSRARIQQFRCGDPRKKAVAA
jgi:hypothetical protein